MLADGERNLTIDAGIVPVTPVVNTGEKLFNGDAVVAVNPPTPVAPSPTTPAPTTSLAPAPTEPPTIPAALITIPPTTTLAPVPPDGKVSAVIWVDANNNGKQDPGEVTLPDVSVEVRNDKGDVVGTARTDANGRYTVENLPAGTYTVKIGSVADKYRYLTEKTSAVTVTSGQESVPVAVFRVISSGELALTGVDSHLLLRELALGLGTLLLGLALVMKKPQHS